MKFVSRMTVEISVKFGKEKELLNQQHDIIISIPVYFSNKKTGDADD
jgi:hypothetical protein